MRQPDVIFLSGSMFGGKSKKIIDVINLSIKKRVKFLVYKPTNDTRDGLFIKSRDYEQEVAAIGWDTNNINKYDEFVTNIKSLRSIIGRPKAVFIDEVHFLSLEDITFIRETCRKHKVMLIASGLETDFKQNKFPAAEYLETYATHHVFYHGDCKECGRDNAVYNILYDENGNVVTEGETIQPGNEEYNVVCEECFNK